MVKIPIVDFTIKRAQKGDKVKREELMQRTLIELEEAQFHDKDIQQFLISAFKEIGAVLDN